MQSPTIGKLADALCKAQSAMHGVAKDASNPFFNSRYATMAATWDAIRGPLSSSGLCVVQTTKLMEGGAGVLVTTLMHTSGEWIAGEYPLNPSKSDPQGLGSCVTYARRYALQAIVGVCPDDDDGNAATERVETKPAPKRAVSTKPKAEPLPGNTPIAKLAINAKWPAEKQTMIRMLNSMADAGFTLEQAMTCLPEGIPSFSTLGTDYIEGVNERLAMMLDSARLPADAPAF